MRFRAVNPTQVNKMQRENSGFPNHNFGTRCETNENVFAFTYAADLSPAAA